MLYLFEVIHDHMGRLEESFVLVGSAESLDQAEGQMEQIHTVVTTTNVRWHHMAERLWQEFHMGHRGSTLDAWNEFNEVTGDYG